MALVGGAGAAPAGSASSAGPPGASGVTARPNYVGPSARAGGADERRAKVPAGSRRPRERLLPFPEGGPEDEGKRRSGAPRGAPVRVMGRQSRFADGMGLAARQTNGRGVPRLRISALRYPLMGMRRVRNRQFGTTVRRDAPRGNAPVWLDKWMEKITMLMFAYLILNRHARACRGHPRLGAKARRGWPEQVRP